MRLDDWVGTICRDKEDEVAIARFGAGFTVVLLFDDFLRVVLFPSLLAFESVCFVVDVFCKNAVDADRAVKKESKLEIMLGKC